LTYELKISILFTPALGNDDTKSVFSMPFCFSVQSLSRKDMCVKQMTVTKINLSV